MTFLFYQHSLYVGFEELRGSYMWGLNICVGQEDKEGTDQILGRISVQDRRTGQGTDRMQDA